MENVLGFGLAGGIVIGLGFLVVRKPIIGLIDGFSGQLIPSEYTPEETEYLEQYTKLMKDGSITENERSLLVTLAAAYGINNERVTQIEASFSSNYSEAPVIEEKIIQVTQQWTDESGHTWRNMSDGSTQWWNGTTWQDYN